MHGLSGCRRANISGIRSSKTCGRPGCQAENITFLTYAKLMLLTAIERAALHPEIIILDEFHRCGAAGMGKGVHALLEDFPDALLLGLTATPIATSMASATWQTSCSTAALPMK